LYNVKVKIDGVTRGPYNVLAWLTVPSGTYNVEISRPGYITVKRKLTISTWSWSYINMSPELAIDQWRAIVKWNSYPRDLDTYGKWGWSKTCWYRRNSWGGNMRVVLERDATNGWGPETLFFSNVGKCRGSSQSCDIKYMINDYTRSGTMLAKGAEVTLYTHTRIAGTWKIKDCPTSVSRDKNWWHVFTIDGRTNKLKWTCKDPPVVPTLPGLREEVFYFNQDKDVPILNGRAPNMQRTVYAVNYGSTSNNWPGFSRRDNFAVRWEGSLKVTQTGDYRFYLTSDDGSKMWIDEATVVNNNGLHGMRTKTGNYRLPTGYHAMRIDFFERGGGAGCIFKYKGPDSGNRVKVVPSSVLRVNPVLGGLTEEVFYFGQGGNLPNLHGRTPNQARQVDTVNYPTTGGTWSGLARGDDFACRWTGFAAISVPGEYEFFITSDDGSKLWMEDKLLVDNNGLHGMRTRSGKKWLSTGFHRLRVEHFERGGGAGMVLEYLGGDTLNQKKIMPKSALRKPAGEPPVEDLNAGLKEQVYYFGQGGHVPRLNGRKADKVRVVKFINYPSTGGHWSGLREKDNFAVRWTGTLRVRQTGSYNFYLGSDDGSKLWMGGGTSGLGSVVINNDGLHGMREHSTTQSVGQLTTIQIDFFEKGGGAGCYFKFSGPDTGGSKIVVPSRNLLKTHSLHGFLEEGFWFHQGGHVPNLAGRGPNQVRVVSQINYPGTGDKWSGFPRKDHFAVRWTGYLQISKPGDYTLYITSDDGSKVYLKQGPFINNDGLHGMREKSATRNLKAGEHALRVEMFEKGGGAGCIFQYKGKDTDNQKKLVGSPVPVRRNAGLVQISDKPHSEEKQTLQAVGNNSSSKMIVNYPPKVGKDPQALPSLPVPKLKLLLRTHTLGK